jgi:hypothetical protein
MLSTWCPALAVLQTLEHLATLAGGGQSGAALLQLGAATLGLQRACSCERWTRSAMRGRR